MLKEIAHFLWHGPRIARMRSKLSPAEFYKSLTALLDQAGLAEHRSELVKDLEGEILEN